MTKIFPVIFLVAISSRAMAAGKNVSKSPSKLCTDFGATMSASALLREG